VRVYACDECHERFHLEQYRPLKATGRKARACCVCGDKAAARRAVALSSETLRLLWASQRLLVAETVDSWDECVETRPSEPIVARVEPGPCVITRGDVRRWQRWRDKKRNE
jgi:hypothetical protein